MMAKAGASRDETKTQATKSSQIYANKTPLRAPSRPILEAPSNRGISFLPSRFTFHPLIPRSFTAHATDAQWPFYLIREPCAALPAIGRSPG